MLPPRHGTTHSLKRRTLFNHPRFVEPLREEIRANTEKIAKENKLEIEHIRSKGTFRKEDHIDIGTKLF